MILNGSLSMIKPWTQMKQPGYEFITISNRRESNFFSNIDIF